VQEKLKGWEKDCEKLAELKTQNEKLISDLKREFKAKEQQY